MAGYSEYAPSRRTQLGVAMKRVARRCCYDIGLSRCRSVYEIAPSGISSRPARHGQSRCLGAELSHMTCDRIRPGGV